MDKEIELEQKKLADHLRTISPDEREKQAYGLLCWLQGHEAGYQAGILSKDEQRGN